MNGQQQRHQVEMLLKKSRYLQVTNLLNYQANLKSKNQSNHQPRYLLKIQI